MTGPSQWERAIRSRFSDRETIDGDSLYVRYWSDLPRDLVLEVMRFVEVEFGLPIGFLRPDDSLALLFTPVTSRNPFRWMEYRTRAGDIASELNRQLEKRQTKQRVLLRTVDELVRAWCGNTA